MSYRHICGVNEDYEKLGTLEITDSVGVPWQQKAGMLHSVINSSYYINTQCYGKWQLPVPLNSGWS